VVKPESKSSAFPGEPVPTPPDPASRAARALTARWAATAPTGVRRRGGDVPRGSRRRVRGLHAQSRASQGAAGPVGRVSASAPRAPWRAPCTVDCDILVHLARAARPRSRALPTACARAEGPGSPKEARLRLPSHASRGRPRLPPKTCPEKAAGSGRERIFLSSERVGAPRLCAAPAWGCARPLPTVPASLTG